MRILKNTNEGNVVFFDIETAPLFETLDQSSPFFDAWEYKLQRDGESVEDVIGMYDKKSSLYPEFAKIICISVGRIKNGEIKLKSYYHDDEAELLKEFCSDMTTVYSKNSKTVLCGHAAIGFDAPFIFKRCMINGITPPAVFDTSDKKPWEVLDSIIDTNTLWKGTAFTGASLLSITTALGLPSPKEDISGKDVRRVYFEGGLARIVKYCESDVVAVANVFKKLRGEPVVSPVFSELEMEKQPLLINLFNGGDFGPEQQKEMKEIFSRVSDKAAALVVIDSMISKAKGKTTKITKEWVKENLK